MNNLTHSSLIGTGLALAIVALVIGAIFPLVAVAAHFAFVAGVVILVVGLAILLFNFLRGTL